MSHLSEQSQTVGGCLSNHGLLPLLPLRGLTVFPNTVLTIDVARDRSVGALQRAMSEDQRIFIVAQRDSMVDYPQVEDLYTVGTVATVKQVVNMPDQSIRVLVEGRARGLVLNLTDDDNSQRAEYLKSRPSHLPS